MAKTKMPFLEKQKKNKGSPKSKRFENHKDKCRCCLEQFKNVSEVKEITPEVLRSFQKLTRIELKLSSYLSSKLCIRCFDSLEKFSDFQQDLIQCQTELYRLEKKELKAIMSKYNDPKLLNYPVVSLVRCDESTGSLTGDIPCIIIKCERVNEQETIINQNLKSENINDETESFDESQGFEGFDQNCSEDEHENSEDEHENHNIEENLFEKPNTRPRKTVVKPAKNSTQKPSQCKDCEFLAPSKTSLLKHRQEYHIKPKSRSYQLKKKKGKQICEICNKTYASFDSLQGHFDRVHEKKPIECDLCGHRFDSKRHMVRHFTTHLPKELRETFICDFCGSSLTQKYSLLHHINCYHRNRPKIPCSYDDCTKSFPSKGHMTTHIRNVHLKLKINKCKLCGETVNNLKQHQQVNHSELFDLFLCDICSFSSKTPSGLYKHKMKHEVPKHKCTYEGCNKRYPFAYNLQNHIKKDHKKELNETCEFCGKVFFKKYQLKHHQLNMHFRVRKKCPVPTCEKMFHHRSNCRFHLKSHGDITEENKQKYWKLIGEMFPSDVGGMKGGKT